MLGNNRLILREANLTDAAFILKLINQPAWKKYIANHQVNTTLLAEEYIRTKLLPFYQTLGFGLWVVELQDGGEPTGMCGLLKRDYLDHIDLGFGFLPEYCGKGIAYDASRLCLNYAFEVRKVEKVAAITLPNNMRSVALLKKLGFAYSRDHSVEHSDETLHVYEIQSDGMA